MLVLTRRGDQSIVFPELDISIQILRVRGNVVKVGIDAPSDITVLRKEVMDDPDHPEIQSRRSKLNHEIRGHLHQAMLGVSLLSKKVDNGMADDVDNELDKIVRGLTEIAEIVRDPVKAKPVVKSNDAPHVRALLVEDDVNQSELLAGYLKLSGFDVTVAEDGADALDLLAESTELPDVVLLDMQMPRLNGPETIARIRRDPMLGSLRVFAVSGTSPMEFGVVEGPGGIDRWFPKPLDPESLVRSLRTELVVTA